MISLFEQPLFNFESNLFKKFDKIDKIFDFDYPFISASKKNKKYKDESLIQNLMEIEEDIDNSNEEDLNSISEVLSHKEEQKNDKQSSYNLSPLHNKKIEKKKSKNQLSSNQNEISELTENKFNPKIIKLLKDNDFKIETNENNKKQWIYGKKSKNLKNQGKQSEKFLQIESKENEPKSKSSYYSKVKKGKNFYSKTSTYSSIQTNFN